MGSWGRRIARIKLEPFHEALERVLPGVDIPGQLPAKVSCLFPHHDDSNPSFWIHKNRWHCFGCSMGGDVVDFVQAYHDIELMPAVKLIEVALGFTKTDAGDEELVALLTLAKQSKPKDSPNKVEWEAKVAEVESNFSYWVRPYLRCIDRTVSDHANHTADYVFGKISSHYYPVPKTKRGMREALRGLRAFVEGWTRGIERDVERMTGKDLMDVSLQPR